MDYDHQISKSLQILKNVALLKARANIAAKFKSPTDLQDVSTYRAQIEKNLLIEESKLSTVVQGKLDALKRSVDLMDEAAEKLSIFSRTMAEVDQKVAETNTDISRFNHLKRSANIRENLQRVITHIDYLVAVPQKVQALQETLSADPISKLREVFLDSIKLDSLRGALIKEIPDSDVELRQTVGEHLKGIPELAKDIVKRLLAFLGGKSHQSNSNDDSDDGSDDGSGKNTRRGAKKDEFAPIEEESSRDFIDHAMLSPSDLVIHLEVSEMHQEYYDRRIKKLSPILAPIMSSTSVASSSSSSSSSGLSKGTARLLLAFLATYNIRPRISQVILKCFQYRVVTCFETHASQAVSEKRSVVSGLVDAGDDLVKLLVDIINEVDPCFPPLYNLVPTFFRVFESHLTPRLEDIVTLLSDTHAVTVRDILDVQGWIYYFVEQMGRFRLQDEPCCARYLSLCRDVLLVEFLDRLKTQVTELFSNIEDQQAAQDALMEDADGLQVTQLQGCCRNIRPR